MFLLKTQGIMDPQIFTVSGLNYKIKHELRSLFPCIQVKGEISNLKEQSSGHIYFSLKDSAAQISCALFRSQTKGMVLPKEGDEVIATGQIDVYPPRGQYQLIVTSIKREGLGDLLLKYEELKTKLKNLGYFDPARKRPLPKAPKRIGIITSPTGAVIRDIVNVLTRRSKHFHLIIDPVVVQGESCPAEVATAIETFNAFNNVDVIIIARGGGSIEDLWGFNSERVARAVFESHIPIISAVGHETDTTLCDLVSDLRAPTPSAAAELVMQESRAFLERLAQIHQMMQRAWQQVMEKKALQLERYLRHPQFTQVDLFLSDFHQQFDQIAQELPRAGKCVLAQKKQQVKEAAAHLHALKPATQIFYIRQKLSRAALALRQRPAQIMGARGDILAQARKGLMRSCLHKRHYLRALRLQLTTLSTQLKTSCARLIERREGLLANQKKLLAERDPRAILKKGYAIIFSQNKQSIILSSEELQKHKSAWVRHSDGETEIRIV